jgi:hypothetical protein
VPDSRSATATTFCELCGAARPTHSAELNQNIGLLVMRLSRKVAGQLCSDCLETQFWSTTLITLVAGWWGLISFLVTPFYLLGNLISYLVAVWDLARPGRDGLAREPFGRSSLAVGVVGLPTLGLCGLSALVGLALGVAGIVVAGTKARPLRAALLGTVCNAACVALASYVIFFGGARSPARHRYAYTVMGDPVAFGAAEQHVLRYEEQVGFGNTPEAAALAREFSGRMQGLQDAAGGARTAETGPLSDGRFLTHVEMHPDTVCFLVHVPGMQAYTGAAREALLDTAWDSARELTLRVRLDQDDILAIGLRGTLFYAALAEGPLSAARPPVRDFGDSVNPMTLHAFFAKPAPPTRAPAATP